MKLTTDQNAARVASLATGLILNTEGIARFALSYREAVPEEPTPGHKTPISPITTKNPPRTRLNTALPPHCDPHVKLKFFCQLTPLSAGAFR
jgi:hypothetical protein